MNSIINKAFGKKETLTEEEFVDVIDNISSDILVLILVYILDKRHNRSYSKKY